MIIFAFVLPFFRQTQTYGGVPEWIITILFVEPFAEGRLEKTTIDDRSINEEEYFGYFLIIVILMVILFSPCRYHFLPRANLWNTE